MMTAETTVHPAHRSQFVSNPNLKDLQTDNLYHINLTTDNLDEIKRNFRSSPKCVTKNSKTFMTSQRRHRRMILHIKLNGKSNINSNYEMSPILSKKSVIPMRPNELSLERRYIFWKNWPQTDITGERHVSKHYWLDFL